MNPSSISSFFSLSAGFHLSKDRPKTYFLDIVAEEASVLLLEFPGQLRVQYCQFLPGFRSAAPVPFLPILMTAPYSRLNAMVPPIKAPQADPIRPIPPPKALAAFSASSDFKSNSSSMTRRRHWLHTRYFCSYSYPRRSASRKISSLVMIFPPALLFSLGGNSSSGLDLAQRSISKHESIPRHADTGLYRPPDSFLKI